VILVHRLRGEPMFINCDLVESIESTPDTIVTMVDGRRLVVSESPDQVIERVRDYRAALVAAASALRSGEGARLFLLDGSRPADDEDQ
jgi:flagellar protein FlbD